MTPVVNNECDRIRLNRFVGKFLSDLHPILETSTQVKECIKSGAFKINDRLVYNKTETVRLNDVISVDTKLLDRLLFQVNVKIAQSTLKIIHQCSDFVVIDKQTGINKVHVLKYLPFVIPGGGTAEVIGNNHKKSNSGLILVVLKNNVADGKFQVESIQNTYLAIVKGRIEADFGVQSMYRGAVCRTICCVEATYNSRKFGHLSLVILTHDRVLQPYQFEKHLLSLNHPVIGKLAHCEPTTNPTGDGIYLTCTEISLANFDQQTFSTTSQLEKFKKFVDKHQLYYDKKLFANEKMLVDKSQSDRLHSLPVEYLNKSAPFDSNLFYVDQNVMIPRKSSLTVVEQAFLAIHELILRSPCPCTEVNVLELGVGSGALLISLALRLIREIDEGNIPNHLHFELHGIDISTEALAVCRRNVGTLLSNAPPNVVISITEGSFKALNPVIQTKQFQVIFSNPPYYTSTQVDACFNNQSFEHEPSIALFTNGQNAFVFYRQILRSVVNLVVAKQTVLVMETAHAQCLKVKQIVGTFCRDNGVSFRSIDTHLDATKLNRCVSVHF